MNHSPKPQQSGDSRDGAASLDSLANPRRIRVGADGRPVTGAATSD